MKKLSKIIALIISVVFETFSLLFFLVGKTEGESDMETFGFVFMIIFAVIIILSIQSLNNYIPYEKNILKQRKFITEDNVLKQRKFITENNIFYLLYELLFKRKDFLKRRAEEIKNFEFQQENLCEVYAIRISEEQEKLNDLNFQAHKLQNEISELQKEILCENIITSDYDNITSEECKNKLVMLKNEIAEFVKKDKCFTISSFFDTKKQLNDNKKQILRCFTAECANIIDGLTFKNVDTARNKLTKSFENINKIFETDGIALNRKMLEFKLNELSLNYAVIVKKEQEREEQRAIREQMLEEEKVRREIEREKAKIEKEEMQFKNEISKLMGYLQKASEIEKQLYIDKIKELEEKLKLLGKDKENVLQREQNTRAGFVYIISNLGSFGENIYKIGMTRRLEPMDRIDELSSASVPFPFDVHAMIFSEDAPGLETTLHNTFKGQEVNKVNLRKEFYNVSLDDIEKVVKEKYNSTVTFTKVAEAAQYRQSLKMAKE